MRQYHRYLHACVGIVLSVFAFSAHAQAETWPSRPVKIIVPLQAGGAADLLARMIATQLADIYKQPFIVENRPGAGATLGTAAVAKAEPNGYTLLVHTSAFTISPAAFTNLPYDVVKDFIPITSIANLPNVLVIAPSKNIRTLGDLVAAARQQKGTFTYASVGLGSASQLSAERLRLVANFQATHVPFRGAPDALTDVLTGRVDFFIGPVMAALPLIQDHKLLAVAVSSSQRSSALPDTPTMAEAGYANTDLDFWTGLFAPAGTPREVVDALYRSIRDILGRKEMNEKFSQLGADVQLMEPDRFARYIRDEVSMYQALAKAAGITPK